MCLCVCECVLCVLCVCVYTKGLTANELIRLLLYGQWPTNHKTFDCIEGNFTRINIFMLPYNVANYRRFCANVI